MIMSNSKLIDCTVKSPNHSGARTHSIDRITPHCVVGQLSAESIGACFPSGREASCNYGIGTDGRVVLVVDESNRSWCSSSNINDQRAITIECASDKTDPYAMNDSVYNKLIDLCVDICTRYKKTKLVWISDKSKALTYEPADNEMLITVHRWFANKSCPGDWLFNKLGDLASTVTSKLGGTSGMQASELKDMTEKQIVAKVGSLFTANQKETGILASVSMAQFILESGYGKSELAQNANNCFGMKKSLSGNTWSGSTWDRSSIYTKKTQEDDGNGNMSTITADFRKYSCVEDSIADHSAYLLGAKNGSALRYAGLSGESDYKKAIQIIKDGGYATSSTYVTNICNIIEKWDLTQYDVKSSTTSTTTATSSSEVAEFPAVPFSVKVIVDDLNIRSSASMGDNKTGQVTGKGTFTITEVKNGWGKLKSGAGWIYIANPDYCTIGSTIKPTSTTTATSKKSVTEIAKEVINGKWGNGDDRKTKLTAAGYDYSAVQKKVNELLSK